MGAALPPGGNGSGVDGGGSGGSDGGGNGGADDAGSNADLLKKGEIVFFTAGGQGCSSCHGADGKGQVGPNIRSKSRTDVVNCLNTVDQMAFLQLTDEEIDAVGVFLAWLKTQP
jgi:mono/diheme cytochrome c family protein